VDETDTSCIQSLFFLTQCTSNAYHAEKLLVCGGQSHYQRTTVAGYFDMKHQVFFGLPALPDPRCCGGGGVVGDYLVLAGGFWGVGDGYPAKPNRRLNIGALPDPGDTITNSLGMKLVYIPAGKFLMGSPLHEPSRQYDESPHFVRLTKAFRLGATEVTQSQWQAVMGANRSNFKGDNLPAENVSWREAVEFCEKLSRKEGKVYRLPTEAEWEYAAALERQDLSPARPP
jgi:formylglycine-generating enzyme required for sulfatase activity